MPLLILIQYGNYDWIAFIHNKKKCMSALSSQNKQVQNMKR